MPMEAAGAVLRPRLNRLQSSPYLLTLLPFLRAPLPCASQVSEIDVASVSRASRLRFVAVAGRARASASVSGIAPCDKAARRWSFVRFLKCPRSTPSFSFVPSTCSLLGGRVLGMKYGNRVLAASCDLSHGSGVLLLVTLYAWR